MTNADTGRRPATNGKDVGALSVALNFDLDGLRDERLTLVEPFAIERTTDAGRCVLEATEINEFGFGENLSEAIADLQAAIAELYFNLEEEREGLGADLATVWSTLCRKVRKVDAARRT